MTSTTPERIRISRPEDCLGLIPGLMGFEPSESLVVLVLVDSVVQLTARVDLLDLEPRSTAALLERIWATFPRADAVFAAFTDDPVRGWEVLADCDRWLPRDRFRTVLLTSGDTWWADGPAGVSGSVSEATTRIRAEAVFHGLVVSGTRADLVASVTGPGPERSEAVMAAADAALAVLVTVTPSARPGLMGRLIRGYEPDVGLTDGEAATLALLSRNPECRDVAVLSIRSGDVSHHRALWYDVVRSSPTEIHGLAVGVLGMAAWVSGEGALQNVCLDRVEELVPGSGIARMLGDLVAWVVPPRRWEELRAEMLATSSRAVRRAVDPPGSRRRK